VRLSRSTAPAGGPTLVYNYGASARTIFDLPVVDILVTPWLGFAPNCRGGIGILFRVISTVAGTYSTKLLEQGGEP